MSKLLQPLTDTELATLDSFLLERLDEDVDGDTGLISISGLDGLFTALVSGPVLPAPEQWLPLVWGEVEPEWDSHEHFEATIELMMRHLNTLAATLDEAPQDFDPLFLEDVEDGEVFIVVDDWCEGYALGVGLMQKEWRAGGAEVEKLLHPIMAFSSMTEHAAYELKNDAAIEKLSAAIPPSVRALYAFWQKRRGPAPQLPRGNSPWDKARK